MRSTGPAPWFAISTNSSEALDPPVWTSDTTSVDTGQATDAARTTSLPSGVAAAGRLDRHRATTRASATSAARLTRCMRDLPAGTERAAAHGHRTTRRSTRTKPVMHAHSPDAHRPRINYDGAHPSGNDPNPGVSVARAKRTQRAEARRRYRSEQSLVAEGDADAIDAPAGDARASRPTASATASKQSTAPRQGVGNAFRAAFRPVDIRSDLRALPQLVRHRALWIPAAITLATTVLFVIVRPEGRNDILGVLTVFLYQYFVVTPAIGGVFIAGFLAPKASWLYGILVGIVAAICYSFLVDRKSTRL